MSGESNKERRGKSEGEKSDTKKMVLPMPVICVWWSL